MQVGPLRKVTFDVRWHRPWLELIYALVKVNVLITPPRRLMTA